MRNFLEFKIMIVLVSRHLILQDFLHIDNYDGKGDLLGGAGIERVGGGWGINDIKVHS